MTKAFQPVTGLMQVLLLVCTLFSTAAMWAENQVMGEIQFAWRGRVESTSGVWVDGQYVGYLKELKGSKRILLLPGEHVIVARQDGYQEFTKRVALQPGETQIVHVTMDKAATGPMPGDAKLATIKINVNPARAAVFVDGLFAGHVGEFEGLGRGMLIAPGTHQIRIALPGYETFETNLNPLPNQKVEIKTNLIKSGSPLAGPLLDTETANARSAPVDRAAVAHQ